MTWNRDTDAGPGPGTLRRAGFRLVASAGVLAIAGILAGLSTWASFTDSTSATHAVSTGVVDIDLGAAGTAANRLDVDVTDVAPGDSAQRAVDLVNSSSLALSQVTLTTSVTSSSLLDTDSTNGLQVAIDSCSVPWTETPVSGGYTYTCAGTTSTVLARRPIRMTGAALANVVLGAGGGTTYLRVTTDLPATAGNTFQGLASDLDLSFTATQRNATNR